MRVLFTMAIILTAALSPAFGQDDEYQAHFDPVPIQSYTLPEALICNDSTRVETAQQWLQKRRPEIYKIFQETIYGVTPPKFDSMTFTVENVKKDARNGKATRKEVVINFTGQPDGCKARMLIYIPNNRPAGSKVPAFFGLNFRGNHTITDEPDVTITDAWVTNEPKQGRINNKSTEASRGTAQERWPLDMILDRGYAVCTMYYGEVAPDALELYRNGIEKSFVEKRLALGGQQSDSDSGAKWGAIGMWAYGLSCGLDYLQTDPDVDGQKVAVIGHSRLGKTALWAGAADTRFALVISNNSGCGGAALYRRSVGEMMERMSRVFRYWFCENLNQYVNKENELPFDMHELIALQAPRPVYVASAYEDIWADPKGEFLSACNAADVYKLFSPNPLGDIKTTDLMPPIDVSVGGVIHYHVRTGKHDITPWDWEQYLNFADKYLK